MSKKSYRKYAATTMAVAVAASAVAPVVAGAEENNFSDVSKDSSHYDSIKAMAEAGIIQGDTVTGEFKPYENVQRIQVAKMLQRALKLEVPSNAAEILRGYTDITENYTQEDRDAIAAVSAAGIFQGDTSTGKFNAWTPINREQMASVLVRAFGLSSVDAGKVNVNLSNVDANHKDSVQILANLGITTETKDYRPAETVLREQFASFLDRTLDKVADAGFKVAGVTGLDNLNKYLQIDFNQTVTSLEPANIKVADAKSGARFGVKEVNLASNGLSAQIELFSHESDDIILQYNRDYTVTVNANGQTSEFTFNRPAFFEERVVSIDVSERQITVNDRGTDKVLKVLDEDFDFQEVLGEKVRIWYNQDNEVVDYKIAEESTVYDAIEFTKDNEIKLLSEGSKHKFSKEKFNTEAEDYKINFYFNGEEVSSTDFDEGVLKSNKFRDKKFNFAKVGLDKSGNVEYIGAYNLTDFLIVDEVEGNDVIGLEGPGTGGEFDAKDATIIKNNKVISLSDLEKGDVLFFNEDANDKDGFAEVYNSNVTGEIDNVFKDSVRIDGKLYDFEIDEDLIKDFDLGYTGAVYLKDDGKVDKVDDKAAEKLQAAGEISVYLDRAGHPVFFGGDLAEVQSNTKASILIEEMKFDSSFKDAIAQIELVTQDGEEELHQVTLKDLKTISFNGEEFDVKNNPKRKDEVAIEWIGGNPVVKAYDEEIEDFNLEANAGELINVVYNDSGKVTGLELFGVTQVTGNEGRETGDSTIEAGDSYVDGKRLLSNTVVFDATDGYNAETEKFDLDADDVTVTTWGDYKGSDINNYTFVYNDKNEVVALVIKTTTTSDKVFESTVITDILRNTDGDIVEIKAYIDGKEVWLDVDKVNNDDLEKGDPAVFEFSKNNKDLVKEIHDSGDKYTNRVTSIDVEKVLVGSREVIDTDGKTYRLVDGGTVLDVSDKNDIETKRLRDLEDRKNVTVVLDSDDGTFVKYFIYGGEVVNDEETDDDTNTSEEVQITFTGFDSLNNQPVELGDLPASVSIADGADLTINDGKLTIDFNISEEFDGDSFEVTFTVTGDDDEEITFTATVEKQDDNWESEVAVTNDTP